MSYTTYQEIQADFKDIEFNADMNVTDTDVTQFIIEADAMINSYVNGKYLLPIPDGDGANFLKMISRNLVTNRIKKIMEVKQNSNTETNQSVVGVLFSSAQCIKFLESIKDGSLPLIGGVAAIAGGINSSFNVTNNTQAVIRTEEQQW